MGPRPPCFLWCPLADGSRDQRHDVVGPEGGDGHDKDHGWNHVGNGEHFHPNHAEAGGQQDKPAAGFEVGDHGLIGQGVDGGGGIKQNQEDDALWNGHQ